MEVGLNVECDIAPGDSNGSETKRSTNKNHTSTRPAGGGQVSFCGKNRQVMALPVPARISSQ